MAKNMMQREFPPIGEPHVLRTEGNDSQEGMD